MEKNKKLIISGVFALVIIFISFWGINFLKGSSIFSKLNAYYIYYDRVDGLTNSCNVTINGFKVGTVDKITLLPKENCRFLVKIKISNDFLLPDSTIAVINSTDIMGSKGIELIFSKSNNFHKPNDTLIGQIEQSLKDQVSIQMLPIKKQAEDLMAEAQKAIAIITAVLNDENQQNLEKSIKSISNTVYHLESASSNLDTILASNKQRINKILQNVDEITCFIKQNKENVNTIFNNLKTLSDTLVAIDIVKTFNEANKVLSDFSNIINKINKGEGSLGHILSDDKLAIEVENTVNSINKLLIDIENNPKKYVHFSLINFGKDKNSKKDEQKEGNK